MRGPTPDRSVTPITSNRYSSSLRPKRSTQAEATRTISRRFATVTASRGLPKLAPTRVLTSTNATVFSRRATRSISRRPMRNRCASICQPEHRRYLRATLSPQTPRRCRGSFQSDGLDFTGTTRMWEHDGSLPNQIRAPRGEKLRAGARKPVGLQCPQGLGPGSEAGHLPLLPHSLTHRPDPSPPSRRAPRAASTRLGGPALPHRRADR